MDDGKEISDKNQQRKPEASDSANRVANTSMRERRRWFRDPNWHMVILTALIFTVSVITARFFYRQLREMSTQTGILNRQAQQAAQDSIAAAARLGEQIEIARGQVDAAQGSVKAIQHQTFQQERPWIKVDIAPTPPPHPGSGDVYLSEFSFRRLSGAQLNLEITLTNVGHSVAQQVSVWTDLSMEGKWQAAQDCVCAIPRNPKHKNSDFEYFLFPEQTVTATIPAKASSEYVNQVFQMKSEANLDVLICVDYMSAIESNHHQTRRAFTIGVPYKGSIIPGSFSPNTYYHNLVLVPRPQGDSAY